MSATIDDNDSSVQYSSGWSQNDTPGSFNNTLHGASTAGATATFSFSGTRIEVRGVVRPSQQTQTLRFIVDTGIPVNFPSPHVDQQSDMTFYASQDLSTGTHTLYIVNQLFSGDPVLLLDFFVVTSPQTPGESPQSSPPQLSKSSTSSLTTTHGAPTSTQAASSAFSPTSLTNSVSSVSGTQFTHTSPEASVSNPAGTGTSTASPSPSHGSYAVVPSTTYSSLADEDSTTISSLITSSSTPVTSSPITTALGHGASHPKVGAIVGGIIAAMVVVLSVIFALCIYRRRHNNRKMQGPAIYYPFTTDRQRALDNRSEVSMVVTTTEGIVTKWSPEMFHPSPATQYGPSGTHFPPPRRKPVPVDTSLDDSPVYSAIVVASRPVSSKSLLRQSVSATSVNTADVSRGSWHAV